MSPLMTVSAFSTIMDPSCWNPKEKLNACLHITLLFIIILSPFYFLLIKILKKKKGKKHGKNYKSKVKALLMSFFEYNFCILLPITVVIKN